MGKLKFCMAKLILIFIFKLLVVVTKYYFTLHFYFSVSKFNLYLKVELNFNLLNRFFFKNLMSSF